ncbi:hypothetical protein Pmani_028586 [Petrolisthes manimaculis]|uniref:Uncharacterized protein n=1 Tax=Petrolisthes manimaculis TaxID=1843537 RepID=A0AAE1P1C2_9EUCA|nr:hypothetical protein Pmani_028586 [Petrolisthes manimaculis]
MWLLEEYYKTQHFRLEEDNGQFRQGDSYEPRAGEMEEELRYGCFANLMDVFITEFAVESPVSKRCDAASSPNVEAQGNQIILEGKIDNTWWRNV